MAEHTITAGEVEADGLRFATLSVGEGPLALCLHGFPDTPHTWRHLLPALADAGYRAVAPWSRGYAPTAVPDDGDFSIGRLALDANALHESLGGDSDAVLLGHDWGAVAGWPALTIDPERWRAAALMAVPPLSIAAGAYLDPATVQSTWYQFFFLHPLAEMVLPMNDFELVDRIWSVWSPGYDTSADLPEITAALGNSTNLAAALGYYRAALGGDPPPAGSQAAQDAAAGSPPQPVLYLHGADDGCMPASLADATAASLVHAGSRVEVIDVAGHFLHLEQPELVNRLIIEHLTA
jgi:pimeloyl-ACP methyl ester carboxylesterase